MPKEYKRVSNNDVRLIWECPECRKPNAFSPEWFTLNGTPTCDCGTDMRFHHAEVRRRLLGPPKYRTT